jgi:hypothetical protein
MLANLRKCGSARSMISRQPLGSVEERLQAGSRLHRANYPVRRNDAFRRL